MVRSAELPCIYALQMPPRPRTVALLLTDNLKLLPQVFIADRPAQPVSVSRLWQGGPVGA